MKKQILLLALLTILINSTAHALSSGQKGGLISGAIGLATTVWTKDPRIIVPVTIGSAALGGLVGTSEERKGRKRRRRSVNQTSVGQPIPAIS